MFTILLLIVVSAASLIYYSGREVYGEIRKLAIISVTTCVLLVIAGFLFLRNLWLKRDAELEIKVQERTNQLAAKNRELEKFAYSVSHDLKAPLRGIDGYSSLLLEEYSKTLNDEAKEYLDNIRECTLQMNQLIDDLLEYSRSENYSLSPFSISINHILNTAINQILKEYPDSQVKFDIQVPDKEITADPEGMHIAIRNLIENAVKFTTTVDNPKIEIGFEEKEKVYILFIRDNGVGFDMQYHNRIFEIFQRLHRFEDYPGTGIGLAMAKKVIERIGGRIWAESSLGMGSVFYLEIPKKLNNDIKIEQTYITDRGQSNEC